jgi:hypothetical protein
MAGNISKTTEKVDRIGAQIDVTKNYSRLPKSFNDPQPNDFGEPVYKTLYCKEGKTGIVKGGNTRG